MTNVFQSLSQLFGNREINDLPASEKIKQHLLAIVSIGTTNNLSVFVTGRM